MRRREFLSQSLAVSAFAGHLLIIQSDYGGIDDGPVQPLFENINLKSITCADARVSAFYCIGNPRLPIRDVNLSSISIEKARMLASITGTIDPTATGITLDGQPATLRA
jgi:hypothetical protein